MIDLHIHSEFSIDSCGSPESILLTAAEKGLTAVSLTEHEGIASFPRARAKASELGIEYINGIEVYHGHNTGFIDELLAFCRSRGLPVSGGSDSHGTGTVGAVPVPDSALESMRRFLAGRL